MVENATPSGGVGKYGENATPLEGEWEMREIVSPSEGGMCPEVGANGME